MSDRRIRTFVLTPAVLRLCGSKVSIHDALNMKELVTFIDELIALEKLPRDTVITWLWYDPRWRAFSMLLWSETFDLISEAECPPYLEIV